MSKTGKDSGINLKTVYCPVCNAKQPQIRIPKRLKELLWGGGTCKNCGCRMDKYGNKRN